MHVADASLLPSIPYIPQAPEGMIPEYRVSNNLWASLGINPLKSEMRKEVKADIPRQARVDHLSEAESVKKSLFKIYICRE